MLVTADCLGTLVSRDTVSEIAHFLCCLTVGWLVNHFEIVGKLKIVQSSLGHYASERVSMY